MAQSTWRVIPSCCESTGEIRTYQRISPEGPTVATLLPAPPPCALLQKPFLAKPLLNRLWLPTFNIPPGTHEATMGRTAAPHVPGQSRAGRPKGARDTQSSCSLHIISLGLLPNIANSETTTSPPKEHCSSEKEPTPHSTWGQVTTAHSGELKAMHIRSPRKGTEARWEAAGLRNSLGQ